MFFYDNLEASHLTYNTTDFLSHSTFWLTLVLCTTIVFMPFYGFTTWKNLFKPTLAMKIIAGMKEEAIEETKPHI